MKLVVSGASGLIGTALVPRLRAAGHDVTRLVRRPNASGDESSWDPVAGEVDRELLGSADAVINLSGVGIGDRRFSDAHKQAVVDSRVQTTSLLAETIAGTGSAAALVNASAIGFYGNRGEGFLSDVVVQWEGATSAAAEAGNRTVMFRTGLVLSGTGGILGRMLTPFKMGMGGRIGSGRQYWSWIDFEDELRAIQFLVETPELSGAFNLTAPNPVPFDDVVAILGKVLNRPTFLPMPSFAAKLAFGPERAQALLFDGQRVEPARLLAAGFEFTYPELEASLRHQLDRPAA
jgi:uncharacterized protein (TIGR01777 family)